MAASLTQCRHEPYVEEEETIPSSSGIDSVSRNVRRVPYTESLKRAASMRRIVPPVATVQPDDRLQRTLIFRFDCVDLDDTCPWSLANVNPNDQKVLLEHLRQYESRTIGELRSGRVSDFKSYDNFADCPNTTAIKRLAELYEAPDSIARFRLGGKKRLYGFLVDNEFHLLWWDPNHEVWPSKKRHT